MSRDAASVEARIVAKNAAVALADLVRSLADWI